MRDQIHGRVLNRTYRPGDKLPRDEDFATELGCARSTVQRAMQDLVDAGVVERKRKGGTHVRPDPVTRATLDIPITRREVEATGARYSYQLVSEEYAVTPADIATGFGLAKPCEMLRLKALHSADGRPYLFEDRWVSLQTCPEITAVDLTAESANEWLVRNKPYSRCDMRFYALEADEAVAHQLDVSKGAALLVIERTTWIESAPITSVRSVTHPGYQLLTKG